MKAYVFSIGEPTTQLCCDQLESMGFEVILYLDKDSLWQKLKRFYTEALATTDEWFIRVDADIIPNSNVKLLGESYPEQWVCAQGFDWYKQDIGAISIHKMHRDVIAECLKHIDEAKAENRPESYLWRLRSVNMKTDIDEDECYGIHGYGQVIHRERIKNLKLSRDQRYDWALVERIESL